MKSRLFPAVGFWALTAIALVASTQVSVEVTSGTAIVYGATVDNVTNDPGIRFLH